MQKKYKELGISCSILIVCGALVYLLSLLKTTPASKKTASNLPIVQTTSLYATSFRIQVKSQGIVQPIYETQLTSEVQGVVKEINPLFSTGQLFKKGAILARLDDQHYQSQLKQAEATVASAQVRLLEEQAKAQAETRNWLKSHKDISNAPLLLLRQPYVNQAKTALYAAQAHRDKLRVDLSKTMIKAPYTGIIRKRAINLGEYITVGKVIGALFSVAEAEVKLPISSEQLAKLALPIAQTNTALNISVMLTQHQGNHHIKRKATIDHLAGSINEQDGMHYLIVRIKNPYSLHIKGQAPIYIGSFITALIQGHPIHHVYQLPAQALYAGNRILMIKKTPKGQEYLHYQKVTLIQRIKNKIIIKGDFTEGQRVSITSLHMPIEGMQVQTLPTTIKMQTL